MQGFPTTAVPVVCLVTAAAALGAWLLVLWFRNARKPVLIGFHVLLGLGSAETLVVFLRTGGLDDAAPARRIALVCGACLVAAIASGFLAPLFGRDYRIAANTLLAAHVAAGVAAFAIVLAFAAQL
jgi:hypothetical protein